jgi:hypothetical protein
MTRARVTSVTANALKTEIRATAEVLRTEMRANTEVLRSEIGASAELLRSEMRATTEILRSETGASAELLRTEMRASAEGLRSEMRQMRTEIDERTVGVERRLNLTMAQLRIDIASDTLRAIQSVEESYRTRTSAVDDEYRDLPERVTALEGAIKR